MNDSEMFDFIVDFYFLLITKPLHLRMPYFLVLVSRVESLNVYSLLPGGYLPHLLRFLNATDV